jgi:hypothetical protein
MSLDEIRVARLSHSLHTLLRGREYDPTISIMACIDCAIRLLREQHPDASTHVLCAQLAQIVTMVEESERCAQ